MRACEISLQADGVLFADEVLSTINKMRNSQLTPVAVLLTCMLLTGLALILMSYVSTRNKRERIDPDQYTRERVEYSIISTDFDDHEDDDEDGLDLPILKHNI
jgi:hypothetical protein